jgi:cobalt-zinc-cadmium efflux system protein
LNQSHQHHPHAGHHGGGTHAHHHHHGGPTDHGKAFAIAIALNSGFVVAEIVYGLIANSTALLADAGHNLSDVLGLLLAWGATLLAKRAPSRRFTYGLRSSSILAALANAMLLMVACGAIAWEAIHRFVEPRSVPALTVVCVAAVGIVVNGLSAWLFARGGKHDLNVRGAYLHLAIDAAVSFGVVLAGLLMLTTGWSWPDPVISLIIIVVIVFGTWELLRESLRLALSAVPARIDATAVAAFLERLPGVSAVHDLHIWGMSTTETALTAHLVMPTGYPGDAFINDLAQSLKTQFSIQHSTIQISQGEAQHVCALQPAEHVH